MRPAFQLCRSPCQLRVCRLQPSPHHAAHAGLLPAIPVTQQLLLAAWMCQCLYGLIPLRTTRSREISAVKLRGAWVLRLWCAARHQALAPECCSWLSAPCAACTCACCVWLQCGAVVCLPRCSGAVEGCGSSDCANCGGSVRGLGVGSMEVSPNSSLMPAACLVRSEEEGQMWCSCSCVSCPWPACLSCIHCCTVVWWPHERNHMHACPGLVLKHCFGGH